MHLQPAKPHGQKLVHLVLETIPAVEVPESAEFVGMLLAEVGQMGVVAGPGHGDKKGLVHLAGCFHLGQKPLQRGVVAGLEPVSVRGQVNVRVNDHL